MRLAVWLWLPVALAFSACQGDYPLEPTACDRYCHVTQGLGCFIYDPASCVLDCERQEGSGACVVQLEATTACFEQTPGALEEYCRYDPYRLEPLPCEEEFSAYSTCWAYRGYQNDPNL